eukprot:Pgem_evm1s1025
MVNSVLEYYSDQGQSDGNALRGENVPRGDDEEKYPPYEPICYTQEKNVIANLKEEGKYDILCTSHAVICNSTCKYDRMILYDLASTANIFVISFHLCVRTSFSNAVNVYVPELKSVHPEVPIIIIGMGAESRKNRVVTTKEAKILIEGLGEQVTYFECDSVHSDSPINQLVPKLNLAMMQILKTQRELEQSLQKSQRGTFKSRRKSFKKTMSSVIHNAA